MARSQRQSGHPHRFRLAAQNHLHAPVRIELDHLRGHLIDDPDVVLRIDAHLLRLQHAVSALADLADEFASPIELKSLEPPCDTARDVPRVTVGLPVRV